jgi:hypothetical protein
MHDIEQQAVQGGADIWNSRDKRSLSGVSQDGLSQVLY